MNIETGRVSIKDDLRARGIRRNGGPAHAAKALRKIQAARGAKQAARQRAKELA